MEKILYNKNGNIISLVEQNNTEWEKVDYAHGFKVNDTYKYNPNYEYILKVNSNIIWIDFSKEKIKVEITDDVLKIEEEYGLLLPLISINIEKLLKITTKEQMDDYLKTYEKLKEEKEFEIMKTAYRIGERAQSDGKWEYSIDQKTKELYKRLKDYNSKEAKQFLSCLVEPLIEEIISKNQMSDCLEKLKVNIFEVRQVLKRYPQMVTVLCIEYGIDQNELINYDEDFDMKIVQKM